MKISIITVVYNSEFCIDQAIQSVLTQTYSDIEYIIVDGASTDGTVERIKSYGNKIDKFISEPDRGIYDAMNKGIQLATGEVIGILNSDDVYAHNGVLEMVAQRLEDKDIDACYGDLAYVDKNLCNIVRIWKSSSYREGLFCKGWVPPHPTFFAKRSVYEKNGNFNLNYILAADFEILVRFLEKCKIRSVYLSGVLVKMRLGGATNKNLKNIIKQNWEILDALKENGVKASPFFFFFKICEKWSQFLKARFCTL